MTTRVSPSAERPAVRAKGTVSPSESPIVASEIIRGSMRKDEFGYEVTVSGGDLSERPCTVPCDVDSKEESRESVWWFGRML